MSSIRSVVLANYKALLLQAKHLFDPNARVFVANRIRQRFRDNKFETGAKRLSNVMRTGRRYLEILKKANLGDIKAIEMVLQHTYGRKGKRRHQLLEPYYRVATPLDKHATPGTPHWSPPAIPAPIEALMALDPKVDLKFTMPNPPVYKPLSLRREANARKRHYQKQRLALRAPLPLHEVEYIQNAAAGEISPPEKTEMQIEMERERNVKRQVATRYLGRYHRMTRRFLKRRYQSLLADYIPVIISTEEGKFHVERAKPLPEQKKFSAVTKVHRGGYSLTCGMKVPPVDENGVSIDSGEEKYPLWRGSMTVIRYL